MSLSKLFQRIIWHNNTTPAINEDNLNAMSKAIDDIDDRVILIGDDVVTVIPQIQAYLEQAESIVEAVEELSQNPPYIGANGNWYVFDTTLEAYKDSGVDASITVDIADITMIAVGAQPYVTNTGTNTDPVFHLFLPQSPQGDTGNGIANIAKTSTQGLVDTYTITMTDGTTYTFTVTNGQNGSGTGDMLQSDYDSDSTVKNAGGIADYVEGELSALPYTNPNLLDNPWFTVNQRGASNYNVANSYTVDRWKIVDNTDNLGIIAVNSGGISIDNTSGSKLLNYRQIVTTSQSSTDLYNSLLGKTVTLSIMFTDGTVESTTGIIPSNPSDWTPICRIENTTKLKGTVGLQMNSGATFVTIGTWAGYAIQNIKAMKLELGSVSTLAQDTAPNYAQELLKCQRYFVRLYKNNNISISFGLGHMDSATSARCSVALPIEMRSAPSVTVSDITKFRIYDGVSSLTPSSVAIGDKIGNIVGIIFTVSNSQTNRVCTIGCFAKENYIDFSADL